MKELVSEIHNLAKHNFQTSCEQAIKNSLFLFILISKWCKKYYGDFIQFI